MTDDEMVDIIARVLAGGPVVDHSTKLALEIVEAIHAGDPLSKRRTPGRRGDRTICEALRELGRMLEDERALLLVEECLDYAQRMNAKLKDYAGK